MESERHIAGWKVQETKAPVICSYPERAFSQVELFLDTAFLRKLLFLVTSTLKQIYPRVPSINCSDGLRNGQIDPKYIHKTMKRSDQDIETSINTKEHQLEVESATCPSSATQEGTEHNKKPSKSTSVKKALR